MTQLAEDTLTSLKYANIILSIVELYHISAEEATGLFYNSETFRLIEDHVADLHCRSDKYLATEIWMESHSTSAQ